MIINIKFQLNWSGQILVRCSSVQKLSIFYKLWIKIILECEAIIFLWQIACIKTIRRLIYRVNELNLELELTEWIA